MTAWAERHAGATRDVCRRTLVELALADERVFCLDSDMGGLEETIAPQLGGRYVNLGIAEANLMTVAAGLAASGKIVFVHTMASFASTRAAEQVKLDIAANRLPVKIVATHGGVAAGHFGPTHFALEDLAVMRALPDMTVVVPADAVEADLAMRAAAALPGPVYLRLGRRETDLVHHAPCDLTIGRALCLRDGGDVTIVACGPHPTLMALQAHEALLGEGIAARVLDVHTLKPIDEDALVAAAAETGGIVTVEEHGPAGGLGGAVAEVVSERMPCRVIRVALPDRWPDRVGDQRELLERSGVTPARIASAAASLVRHRLSPAAH